MRFVAIGDSTVEGLDDPDGRGGYRGWANRLAERLAREHGELLYANLAVRGRTTAQVRATQLAPAVAMQPDVAAVVTGMNDLLRRRFDAASLRADIESMQRALAGAGARVITFTLPDLSDVLPIGGFLRHRVDALNDAIRAACAASGAICCDLALHAVARDPRLWSDDRLHANAIGHARVAEALAEHLGLPGATHSWADPLPDAPPRTFATSVRAELAWIRRHLLPWIVRHARGRSSGDGVSPKYPQLAPFRGER